MIDSWRLQQYPQAGRSLAWQTYKGARIHARSAARRRWEVAVVRRFARDLLVWRSAMALAR